MKNEPVCPWWLGYVLITPVRKLKHNPYKILSPHIKKGMNVLDFGSAMGFFSLPLAELTGERGSVYCVDIQEKMLEKLEKRAEKAGLSQIIKPRLVGETYNTDELQSKIDFIMLFAVVHEVPDRQQLFNDLFKVARTGCKVLFAEPKGHVGITNFQYSLQLAQVAGFKISEEKPIPNGLCAFLLK